MKKKILKITMAFLLALCTLTGCGNDSKSDEKSDKKSKAETTTVAEDTTEEKATESEEKTTVKSDEETTDADNGSSPSAAEGTDFKRGVVDGKVYTNEFTGFKLTVPDDWRFADDETILQMMNLGAETAYSSNADTVKKIAEQATITDALCMNTTSTQNITITYENLNKNIVYALLTIFLTAVTLIMFIKEGALFVMASAIFGTALLAEAYNCVNRAKKDNWKFRRVFLIIMTGLWAGCGIFILFAPENTLTYYMMIVGRVAALDGSVRALLSFHKKNKASAKAK